MGTNSRSLWAMALALCQRCGIPRQDVEDVAAEVVRRVWHRPADRQYAEAVEMVRRRLARHLGVPRRSLPEEIYELRAFGEYAELRRRYARIDHDGGEGWLGGFDIHSRRFAVENGVCPKCARVGRFTEDAGRCACGFAYP